MATSGEVIVWSTAEEPPVIQVTTPGFSGTQRTGLTPPIAASRQQFPSRYFTGRRQHPVDYRLHPGIVHHESVSHREEYDRVIFPN